ncbi:MogA/MoaB family molybdenum cofactor biosynthesis protein [Bacillus massiliglaciei]|uniref:MogA/MoaB family molybdenum cofactor biosynthesis protein n=1 Tax=Bacillus massiliglaciei TaxID=1816693 RepID=UPI000ACA5325|nr:MogA/MoaB family molybdenum cofactor biosynthesis protein [Bacillus massiliglaciei]
MSVFEHKKGGLSAVSCKVITVSDTRNKETDKSGKLIIELLESEGHKIAEYEIVKDDKDEIGQAVLNGCRNSEISIILLNGGTGIAKRDVTIETIQPMLHKEIPGFGELFRMLSYQEDIGSAAIMSRALAGVVADKAVFSLPGSTGAVRLGMNKLILPELRHVAKELQKD